MWALSLKRLRTQMATHTYPLTRTTLVRNLDLICVFDLTLTHAPTLQERSLARPCSRELKARRISRCRALNCASKEDSNVRNARDKTPAALPLAGVCHWTVYSAVCVGERVCEWRDISLCLASQTFVPLFHGSLSRYGSFVMTLMFCWLK